MMETFAWMIHRIAQLADFVFVGNLVMAGSVEPGLETWAIDSHAEAM
jgi:hypothetical protein